METVLATLYLCIAQLAVGIRAVVPTKADALLDTMGILAENRSYRGIGEHWYPVLAESEFKLAAPTPLFPRLELTPEVAA